MKSFSGLLTFTLILLWGVSASSLWTENGTAICTSDLNQTTPQIISDGSGGAIMTWADNRGGYMSIYAQRVDASGSALWWRGGRLVCWQYRTRSCPQLVSDCSGGAIITWYDNRDGNNDIYAQRIDAGGSILGPEQGIEICTASGDQERPQIVSDGSGGAIITWWDDRADNDDIYAQRIDADGSVLWQTNGVAVCSADEAQYMPFVTSDGSGGAIITWNDGRNGEYDIYAQRIDHNGAVVWQEDGVAICTMNGLQIEAYLIPDGSNGAIMTWNDERDGKWDVYAQRVDANGNCLWPTGGVPVCNYAYHQSWPRITPDGSGGAIIVWHDLARSNDIYAQRVDASGSMQWALNGVPVCSARLRQFFPQITPDSEGGAIVIWEDERDDGEGDVYVQRIDGNGRCVWPADGVPVCTAPSSQHRMQIVSDEQGGAFAVWEDKRNGDYTDIYATHVVGVAPTEIVSFDIRPGSCPNPLNPKSKGVLPAAIIGTVEYDISAIDASSIKLEGISPILWSFEDVAAPVSSDEECACSEEYPDGITDLVLKFDVPELFNTLGELEPGETFSLEIAGTFNDGTEFTGCDCVVIVGKKSGNLIEARKQIRVVLDSYPEHPVQRFQYYLPERSNVEIAIFDVAGRQVKKFERVSKSVGTHTQEWNAASQPSGVYFLRLVTESHVTTRKIVLVR